jgi:hypothetical protein
MAASRMQHTVTMSTRAACACGPDKYPGHTRTLRGGLKFRDSTSKFRSVEVCAAVVLCGACGGVTAAAVPRAALQLSNFCRQA